MLIRAARPQDATRIAAIWEQAWHDGHDGHVPDELVAERTPETFLPRARERVERSWVGELDGAVAGFVTTHDDEVEQVFVAPEARGSGLAVALLQRAERAIRDAGHPRAWLSVVAGNERARRFYARQGWRDAGPSVHLASTVAGGTIEVPVRRYEKDLPDEQR